MPLYELLLQRLQQLPLSVRSLNALSPLLTSAFTHIPPPARGPAAFRRFFYVVHSRLSPPVTTYSDDLRVCIDACMRGYGGEWPSGMVPLSSQTQTQLQLQSETRLLIDLLAESEFTKDIGCPNPYMRSIEVNESCFKLPRICIEVDRRFRMVARGCTGLPVRSTKRGGACLPSTFRPWTFATWSFVRWTGLPGVSRIARQLPFKETSNLPRHTSFQASSCRFD